MEVQRYITDTGVDVVQVWLSSLRDKQIRWAILRRLDRLKANNLGYVRPLRKGVWELKIDIGPGHRVYYAHAGQTVILLLCGGDKGSQDADIHQAVGYWADYQQRIRRP